MAKYHTMATVYLYPVCWRRKSPTDTIIGDDSVIWRNLNLFLSLDDSDGSAMDVGGHCQDGMTLLLSLDARVTETACTSTRIRRMEGLEYILLSGWQWRKRYRQQRQLWRHLFVLYKLADRPIQYVYWRSHKHAANGKCWSRIADTLALLWTLSQTREVKYYTTHINQHC